jgi:prepilin-type N-terminal cleavage/methylation domain-containing protein
MNKIKKQKGFTLIEILVVIGIIAILAAVVLVAINPARQFAQARNSQRVSNVNAILNAIGQKMADCKGKFDASTTECPTSPVCPTLTPGTPYNIFSAAGGVGDINLSCLVPTYISILPSDPKTATGNDTGYDVIVDSTTFRTTVSAPDAELGETISVTR